MKVWVLHMESYGEVSIHAESTDVAKIPYIEEDLSYVSGKERDDFLASVERVRTAGSGTASIEERFFIELVEVAK